MRNNEKYIDYTLGVAKGSALHDALIAESEELGSRHVPLIICSMA